MSLSEAWEREAAQWITWARAPGHDSYWRFHHDQFLELVPAPGRLTLDIGCGEGRLTRDLKARRHTAVGLDPPRTMSTPPRCPCPAPHAISSSHSCRCRTSTIYRARWRRSAAC